MIDACLICVPMAIIFARAYYVIFSWSDYANQWWHIFYVWEGGLAIYGAIIGGVLGLLIFAKWRKVSVLDLLDAGALGVVVGQIIGRWGNFANQEAFGNQVTNPALQWFPFAVNITRVPHYHYDMATAQAFSVTTPDWHYATFFYEMLWNVLVLAFLFFWYRKRAKSRGNMFVMYLALYGLGRAFIELLRQDSLWLIPGVIRISSLLGAILFIGGVIYLILRRRKPLKPADIPEKYSLKHKVVNDIE
jgi:phosphatidylglycerol---prolipoprotein diacylglyceryl transferase